MNPTQLLNELRERVKVINYSYREVVKDELPILRYLVAKYMPEPLCAMCSHPHGEHAAIGDWCPNPPTEKLIWNRSQRYVADLQSLRKGA